MSQDPQESDPQASPALTPTVYVVDDDPQACKGVLALLQLMNVNAESYSSAEEFLDAYDGRRPACLVTDVRMLGMSGLELQERLLQLGITMSVVVLTAYATIPTTVRAMKNGAITLMEKPCNDDELWDAIRLALGKDLENWEAEQELHRLQAKINSLTPKERTVLEYIVSGDANKIVAKKMDCSIRTVENHRQRLFQKLEADSFAELVRIAVAAGLGPPEGLSS